MNEVPLFGDTFEPVEVPELSIDSKLSQVPKLPDIGTTESITQKPLTFNFPLFSSVPKPNDIKTPSLEDRISDSLSKLSGNYAGEVKQWEASKYNDSSLGYSSSRNNDDVYSDKGNWYSGSARFLNETINWTKAGLYSLKGVYDAVAEGDMSKVWDNDFNKEMLAESEGMQYLYPIYKSQSAQNNPWNVFATGNIAENMSNLGMVAGTIISTLAQDLAIATGSALLAPETLGGSVVAGAGGIIANTGKNIALAYKNINALSNLMSSAKTANRVYDAVKAGESLTQVIKNTANVNNVFKASSQLIKTSLVSSGEAGFEAASVYDGVKNKLLEQNPNANVSDVLKTAQAAGNLAYGLNQAVLNLSNTAMYGKLLTGKLTTNTLKNLPLEILADTATGTLDIQAKKGFLNSFGGHYLKTLGKNMLSEGGEEGLQFAIQNASDEYYSDKYKNQSKSLFDYIGKGLASTLSDEGLANMAGGAFIGGLTGVSGGLFGDATGKFGSDLSYKLYNKQIQDYKDAFQRTNNLFDFANKAIQPISLEGKSLFEVKNEYDNFVHDFALFGIKQGNIQARIDALQDFKKADPIEFAKYSGIEVRGSDPSKASNDNQPTVAEIVDSIINRIKLTQDSYNEISSAYGVNPFVNEDFYTNAIGKLANRTKQTEKAISADVWEVAKDQAIRQLVQLKSYSKREQELSKEILDKIPESNKGILESFFNSPIQTLNLEANKINQASNLIAQAEPFFEALKNLADTNAKLAEELGDLTRFAIEKQQIEDTKKFYENISQKFQNGDLRGFYSEFYKYLTNQQDVEEKELNEFILNTSDVIKLRLGKEFLSKELKTLQTKQGQKDLIKQNLDNLAFYTLIDELKEKKANGEIISATVEGKGQVIPITTEEENEEQKPEIPVQEVPKNKVTETVQETPQTTTQQVQTKIKATYKKVKEELSKLIKAGTISLKEVIQKIKDIKNGKLNTFAGVQDLTVEEQDKLISELSETDNTSTATKSIKKPEIKPTLSPIDKEYDEYFRSIYSTILKNTIDSFTSEELKGLYDIVIEDLNKRKDDKSINLGSKILTFRLLSWVKKEIDKLINKEDSDLINHYKDIESGKKSIDTISDILESETLISLIYDAPEKLEEFGGEEIKNKLKKLRTFVENLITLNNSYDSTNPEATKMVFNFKTVDEDGNEKTNSINNQPFIALFSRASVAFNKYRNQKNKESVKIVTDEVKENSIVTNEPITQDTVTIVTEEDGVKVTQVTTPEKGQEITKKAQEELIEKLNLKDEYKKINNLIIKKCS